MKCPKCGEENSYKNGIVKCKQRYTCRECKYNYRTNKFYKYYSDEEKKEALRYHNEGIGFRRIERLLGMSNTIVIRWVKQASQQIQEIVKKAKVPEKVAVLELDELCAILKKTNKLWVWTAVERITQITKGFYVGSRETTSFEKLSKNIDHIEPKIYATDG